MEGVDIAERLRTLMEAPDRADRLQFARTPTPIHLLPRLSEKLGVRIYCKRDDMTGFGFGGSKARKLEFLLKDALDRGCDTLVTWGANQSNWCCMTAVAGAVFGLEVYLVLSGAAPERDTGNLRLARIAGAKISHLHNRDNQALENATLDLVDTLRARGKRPYRMVVGGSTGLGALGYARAFLEIEQFSRESGISFSTIVHATGSGGTQAGLVCASTLLRWDGRIIGVSTSRPHDEQCAKVRSVLQQLLPPEAIDPHRVIVDDAFVGAGYGCPTEAGLDAIESFARLEGIFLDEVYTGKAAAALIEYARSGRFAPDENVLFLHTGGTAQLFE